MGLNINNADRCLYLKRQFSLDNGCLWFLITARTFSDIRTGLPNITANDARIIIYIYIVILYIVILSSNFHCASSVIVCYNAWTEDLVPTKQADSAPLNHYCVCYKSSCL